LFNELVVDLPADGKRCQPGIANALVYRIAENSRPAGFRRSSAGEPSGSVPRKLDLLPVDGHAASVYIPSGCRGRPT